MLSTLPTLVKGILVLAITDSPVIYDLSLKKMFSVT